jgi:hypothetical protein
VTGVQFAALLAHKKEVTMNTFEKLRGNSVHLKLISMPKPLPVKVTNVENYGVWIAGTSITQAVVQAGTVPAPGVQNLVVFVPFQNIEWLVAAQEPGL